MMSQKWWVFVKTGSGDWDRWMGPFDDRGSAREWMDYQSEEWPPSFGKVRFAVFRETLEIDKL